MKKGIIGLILGGIIFSSITVYAAYKYRAGDIGYTPSNEKFDVDNVSDAIKELYENTIGPTYIDTSSSGSTYKGIVYLDQTNLEKSCNQKNSKSITGTKTGCMKWYVFDDSEDNLTMILDHNTTATQQWYSSKANVAYENSLVKPVVDKLVSESGWKVTPRLITGEEIKTITGNEDFSFSTITWYCFESNEKDYSGSPWCKTGKSKYYWLFDYMLNCTNRGGTVNDNTTYSYWTSTTISNNIQMWVYCVDSTAALFPHDGNSTMGIRPVITVSKSVIK